MSIARVLGLGTSVGAMYAYNHLKTAHPAPIKPEFRPGDKLFRNAQTGMYENATEEQIKSSPASIYTVQGYSGHGLSTAQQLKLNGEMDIWVTKVWAESCFYAKEHESSEGEGGIATIASLRPGKTMSIGAEWMGNEPTMPVKEDGYVAVKVDKLVHKGPERNSTLWEDVGHECYHQHVKPVLDKMIGQKTTTK